MASVSSRVICATAATPAFVTRYTWLMFSTVSCGATLARVQSPLSVIWQGAGKQALLTVSRQASQGSTVTCSEISYVSNLHTSRVTGCSSHLVAAR